ncbi:MAG: lytic transglycosylase [Peptococcaceae bacterium BRH_c4a]|nr:MAG: lytic transglycosylase [Peptococcaceae bacterium BRH_c4a]
MSYKRKKRGFNGRRIIIVFSLILLLFNAGNIGRFVFPIPYRQVIFKEAEVAGIDGYLLAAITKTESNFNPTAVSVKGARGLMQIMPDTGKWVAGQKGMPNFNSDLLFNPEFNISIGAYYVSDLYKEYSGDTVMVLAAYNAGRGNVKKWLGERIWTGDRNSIDQIPFPETRQFIRKVLFYQQTYRYLYNPEKNSK